MKKRNHPVVRGKAPPGGEPPAHSNWVLLESVTHGAEVNFGDHYMGATHRAEVAAFDDLNCDFAV